MRIEKIAAYFLISLSLIVWGIGIGAYHIFPYNLFSKYVYFFYGTFTENNLSILQKISNDLDITPYREIISYTPKYRERDSIRIDNIKPRRDAPLIYQTEGLSPGYRAIFGTFDFEESRHGAILLDETGNVIHTWFVHEQGLDWAVNPDTNKQPFGFEVLTDGSIIFSYSLGNSIQRFDWCGKRIWATEGYFHHTIDLGNNNTAWALYAESTMVSMDTGSAAAQLNLETGEIIKIIKLADIMKANPNIDILGMRQSEAEFEWQWSNDFWHTNDVEPLLDHIADAFVDFNTGDLLFSLRSLNLIFVADPETLKIKWWRSGETRRQHDPDWEPDGTISVYDNNPHRNWSRIKKINPENYTSKVTYSGKNEDFYSWKRGDHQNLSNGNILITIPHQGRVIEVSQEGKVVFEFINTYDIEKEYSLFVMKATFLEKDFFEFTKPPTCN